MSIQMTAEQAGWVRAHVWTKAMRKTYRETPGFYSRCACQFGLTTHCRNGSCQRCHRSTPAPAYATVICRPGADTPAYFAEPYRHTTWSATGRHHERMAMVWLADRICRWICPHSCHHTGRTDRDQLALFQVTP